MVLFGFSSTGIDYRTARRAEQDQTARMCKLILLYTFRKIKSMFANGGLSINEI